MMARRRRAFIQERYHDHSRYITSILVGDDDDDGDDDDTGSQLRKKPHDLTIPSSISSSKSLIKNEVQRIIAQCSCW